MIGRVSADFFLDGFWGRLFSFPNPRPKSRDVNDRRFFFFFFFPEPRLADFLSVPERSSGSDVEYKRLIGCSSSKKDRTDLVAVWNRRPQAAAR